MLLSEIKKEINKFLVLFLLTVLLKMYILKHLLKQHYIKKKNRKRIKYNNCAFGSLQIKVTNNNFM
jgi:hypothetical protein